MSTDERAGAIVVFDGDCVFCSGWVRFLLHRDRAARFHFAALQTPAGRALLLDHGLDPDDPSSFLLLDGERAWTDSDAILRVLAGLGGAWRVAGVFAGLPRGLRDRLYRLVARNRYRWFGRRTTCFVPTDAERARFID